MEVRFSRRSEESTGKPIVSRVCWGSTGMMRGISPPVVCGEMAFVGVTGVPPGWRTLRGEMVASEPDPWFDVFNRPNERASPTDVPA